MEKVINMTLTIEIENPQEVEQLLSIFKNMNLENVHIGKKTDSPNDLLHTINRPIKKKLDIEALKKAKNYNGVNRERFNRLVKEINITEPIEVLLAQLSQ